MRPGNGSESELLLKNVSVVLVGTRKGGNIGSVARAMRNMGLSQLKLIRPREVVTESCEMMAGKAFDLVTSAQVYSDLSQALAEENLVIGTTSGRQRRREQTLYTPREMASVVHKLAKPQRTALVFGPERAGLTDDQLARCQCLVSIPSHPDYPVLNLAQAVMILAYEIFLASQPTREDALQVASDKERELMFAQVERTLLEIGFLSTHNPGHIMRSIRRFLGRADLTSRDVQIMRGIMSQMEWYVREGHRLPPEKVAKP